MTARKLGVLNAGHGTLNGAAAFRFTVPQGTPPGSYAVSATGSQTGADAFTYFYVQ
jgi:hypothetical protein